MTITGCRDCADWIVTRGRSTGVSCDPCKRVRKSRNHAAWRAAVASGVGPSRCIDCDADLRRRKVNIVARCRSCAARGRHALNGRLERVRRYGITLDDFDALFEKQGGRCAICRSTSPSNGGRDWSIDHDHSCCPQAGSCGRCVRGILCTRCNGGLGSFGDDPERLSAAIDYLRASTTGGAE